MAEKSQANLPAAAEEIFTPWELMGESRRDCQQDRAKSLAVLAFLSLLTGCLSFLCPLSGLLGLALGQITKVLARRDLDSISAGHMDQKGYGPTRKVLAHAYAAMSLSLLSFLFLPTWIAWAIIIFLYVKNPGFGIGM
jgi:hypothetical protein